MMTRRRRIPLASTSRALSAALGTLLVAVLGACDGDPDLPDAGTPPTCAAATECDDGVFCNGVETCTGGACESGAAPCMAMQTCEETARLCVTDCIVAQDADGDGYDALDCGGADCDDADAARFPDNAEVCDEAAHDEDCDPSTFGMRDVDGDGYVADTCCNADTCGDDCDDDSGGAHPGLAEICGDDADNDCDGATDEGIEGVSWWRDVDGDGWGALGGTTMTACARPEGGWSNRTGDCNDVDADAHPAAREVVGDGVDNDCDGVRDETYELRGGIESHGASQAVFPYRLTRQRIEATHRSCSETGRQCVTGGIVSGTGPWGGQP